MSGLGGGTHGIRWWNNCCRDTKRKLVFQSSIFRGYVQFQGCMNWVVPLTFITLTPPPPSHTQKKQGTQTVQYTKQAYLGTPQTKHQKRRLRPKLQINVSDSIQPQAPATGGLFQLGLLGLYMHSCKSTKQWKNGPWMKMYFLGFLLEMGIFQCLFFVYRKVSRQPPSWRSWMCRFFLANEGWLTAGFPPIEMNWLGQPNGNQDFGNLEIYIYIINSI